MVAGRAPPQAVPNKDLWCTLFLGKLQADFQMVIELCGFATRTNLSPVPTSSQAQQASPTTEHSLVRVSGSTATATAMELIGGMQPTRLLQACNTLSGGLPLSGFQILLAPSC